MPITPLALVPLKFFQNSVSEVVPVVILSRVSPELPVVFMKLEHCRAVGSRDSRTGSPDTFRIKVSLLGRDAMLRQPAELFQEEIHRPFEYRVVGLFTRDLHGLLAETLLEHWVTDAVAAHAASPAEIPASKPVVVLDGQLARD